MVREFLNVLHGESIDIFKATHSGEDNDICIEKMKFVWDDLKRLNIRLALQLHVQYFHMTYLHRWSMP